MTRSAATASLLLLASSALVLAGCTPDPSGENPDPPAPEESEPQQPADGLGDTACVVGTWSLVVPDYRLQSEAYLLGLGVPITEFDMTGSQIVRITQDGLLDVQTDLTTSGVIVAGDSIVPISVTTVESASAEWGWDATSPSGGLLEVALWEVLETSTSPDGPDGLDVPPPRFDGENATLLVDCDAQNMLLQGGGPLGALFERQ